MKLIWFVLIPFLFINLILSIIALADVSTIKYRLILAVLFIVVAVFMHKKDKKTEI